MPRFRRPTLVLTTAAAILGPAAAAAGMPARSAPVMVIRAPSSAHAAASPVRPTPPAPGDGADTLTVVLLSAGTLVAGGALGFGAARLREARPTLRPH